MLSILLNAICAFLFIVILVLLADWLWYGQESYPAKLYRYYLYYYWVHVKRYHWEVMRDFGGSYITPKLNRADALKFVADSGEAISGTDDQYKIIFVRAKK